MPILINSGDSVSIDGTVTANAGTNLNTSLLALESGGNLASAASFLSTIDADTSAINSFLNPSTLRPVAFDSYTSVAISSVTGANQVLISAPGANKQIWVYGWLIVATAAGTFALQDEDDTAKTGAITVTTASGAERHSDNLLLPIFKVATNKALEIDVVTATVNGSIEYAIVSV
jgi:hypothetical protein